MFNFIKVKDNVWLNINSITSIEYYPVEKKESREDVFTRKEELSKEESEWLIDFITKENRE